MDLTPVIPVVRMFHSTMPGFFNLKSLVKWGWDKFSRLVLNLWSQIFDLASLSRFSLSSASISHCHCFAAIYSSLASLWASSLHLCSSSETRTIQTTSTVAQMRFDNKHTK
jgi:hypothetical protein